MAARVTIRDIANRAGVSKGAVSYALNGRAGVSEPTRRRILAVAADLGWHPSSAARALSDGRAGALGLLVDRPANTLGIEPFFMQLISGMQAILSAHSIALLFQVVEDREVELELYRRWWAEQRVDGIFLVDLAVDDPRIPVIEELQLPAMVIGGPHGLGSLPGVWSDDAAAVRRVVEHLTSLGHRRIGRVAGPAHFWHTEIRSRAMSAAAEEASLPAVATVHTDYTGKQGDVATRELLTRQPRPTAVLYDNDVMAVAGVTAAYEMGMPVPSNLSVVAWDDSALCQLVHPRLSALSRDISAYGAHAAQQLLGVLHGESAQSLQDTTAELTARGSTAPPPAGTASAGDA